MTMQGRLRPPCRDCDHRHLGSGACFQGGCWCARYVDPTVDPDAAAGSRDTAADVTSRAASSGSRQDQAKGTDHAQARSSTPARPTQATTQATTAMTDSDVSRCRSCGAQVVFRLNPKSGKSPPYDYPATACECVTRVFTTHVVGEGTRNVVECDPDCAKCKGTGSIWVSHFATCPQAPQWKGKARM